MIMDVLVDNTVAKNFCYPADEHYKAFIKWLFDSGVLVVTRSLLNEYTATCATSSSNTSMPAIIGHLMQQRRLTKFSKSTLQAFRFTASFQRSLRSNRKDHDNIKAVMLSIRKYALSHDDDFRHDVNNCPGHSARAEQRPQDLPYA